MSKLKIAISIGDLNGIGIEIALKSHEKISKLCEPIYCINRKMLNNSATLLELDIPKDFKTFDTKGEFKIKPAKVSKKSGQYSYDSFLDAITLTQNRTTKALVTLPINKESWAKAGIDYKGHTEVLRDFCGSKAIMMLGCKKMFVSLFTEHIPISKVSSKIKEAELTTFLIDFYNSVKNENILVLGLNPHAGDGGVLGEEEIQIFKAIKNANKHLNKKIFKGPAVPDIAFSKSSRKKYKYFVAMYHDQGLAPLKSLYFDESINVSLNLPLVRTSVDHGTAFDIAYNTKVKKNTKSYINAIKEAIILASRR